MIHLPSVYQKSEWLNFEDNWYESFVCLGFFVHLANIFKLERFYFYRVRLLILVLPVLAALFCLGFGRDENGNNIESIGASAPGSEAFSSEEVSIQFTVVA